MDLSFWLLNLAYAVYVISPVFKTMVKLRLVLLAATSLFIAYGLSSGVMSVTWWNIPFGVMHLSQLWRISPRGSRHLGPEAETVRAQLMPTLNSNEFARVWGLGVEDVIPSGTVLTTEGERVEDLVLVLGGSAVVEGQSSTIEALDFVGEMSLLLGARATRSVRATTELRVRRWSKIELLELGERHPHIQQAGLIALGQNVAQKAASQV